MSLAWVIRGRKKSGPYFLIYNHATGEAFFNDKAIRKAITFPFPTIYVAMLCLMILPFPVLIFFGLADLWQVARFHRAGVRPLLVSLASELADLPTHAKSTAPSSLGVLTAQGIASELKELAALKESGALSQVEFEAAKAQLLASGA